MSRFTKNSFNVLEKTLKELKRGYILISGDIEAALRKIKDEPGKDIWLFGSASLTSSLFKLGLVDEISLVVHPIILGSGNPLFSQATDRVPPTLVDTKAYLSGLVSLTYTLA
ncbi:dihydrofolate reductase family protein [Hymenobacter sp. B1770]|uniref:dihydrofolate reductase family protein n=1 Tax=Hymenobacter sp. B1770 TaxID=1718788 RepID=UPI003CEBCB14